MPNVDEYMIMLEFTNPYNYYFILYTIDYNSISKNHQKSASLFDLVFHSPSCSPPRCAKWSRNAMVTHSLPVPVPVKPVAACSAAQPKRWSCVAGRRDASTKSTSLYSSPRLPPWAWKVMMLTNHHHRFCWRERGGCTLWFFLSIHSENMGSFSFMMAHVVIDVFQMVQYFQTIPMSRWICESLDS